MSTAHGRALAAASVAIVGLIAASASYGNLGTATVKTGHWHGVEWKLTAEDDVDGSYCLTMKIGGHSDASGCGSIREHGISYMGHSGRPAPNYLAGPVIARARTVHVRFFDRPAIDVATIVPPRALARGTRFFVAFLPCPATPRSFVARNAAGRVVARLVIPHQLGPKTTC